MLEKNIILNNNLKVLIIALVATLYCHCAYAYSNSDFDKNIRVAMTESKLTGVAVTVFQGDKILFSKGYGYANIDAAIPMSTTAVFRVASLSKMVTAMAIMQLYDCGQLNLDDDVSKYLGYRVANPMYPDDAITVRQLLLHTSSFKDSGCYNDIIENNARLFRSIALWELITPKGQYYNRSLFAQYAPGETFCYSNLGYGLLGSIVECVSGMRFDDYCKKHILLPLGMDAGFQAADIVAWQNIGVIYKYQNDRPYSNLDETANGRPQPVSITASLGNAIGQSPTGGLRVSAEDMTKFMQALANDGEYAGHRILSSSSIEVMKQVQWMGMGYEGLDEQVGLFRQEGLGMNISDQLCEGWRLRGHPGDAYGLIAGAYYDEVSKLGFVYIINGGIYKTAMPLSPHYIPERAIAEAIHERFVSPVEDVPLKVRAPLGKGYVSVNGRVIYLPVGAVVDKDCYIPLVTLNDLLGVSVDEGDSDAVYLGYRSTSLKLTPKDKTITVNGYMNTYLPKPPYFLDGTLYVPLMQAAQALKIKVEYAKGE